MARWLGATTLLATLATLHAWRPPPQPILLPQTISHIRIPRHAHNTIHHLHILEWHLELQENHAIRSPYYNQCQFYKGRILYEAESTVTVTECEGQLYGLLQVRGEDFVLQPNRPDGSHVLRRRDVLVSEQPAVYNLTGDTVTDLDIEFEEDEPKIPSHVHTRQNYQSDIDYFRNMLPVSRPISGGNGLWLELAIVADHTMVKFHGRERVKHYILAIMNIVSAIFNDHSLDSNMTLVINKLFLYEEKDSVIKYGNVKKSLEAVNKWNYRHLMKLPADSTGWDATVWLTRAQLGGPSGFAPVGGVCNRHRSAAIDRDEGLTSAFVIAHELGHLLGLTHDSDEQCESDGIRGSVMAPTVLATLHNYAWSSCSRQQFHEKSKKWWCLHERSRDDGVELGGAKELSNYVFTMDEQCRTEFGEGFSVCKSVKVRSPCAKLWCAHRSKTHVCHSKRAPPLEGTPCGPNQWCVDRVCELMPEHAVENKNRDADIRNPQWGEWSPWSECNVKCGYGLRSRTRRCRDRGAISSSCEGAGSQMATCWTGSPCASTRDARSDACSRHGSHLIPHLHVEESNHCETWCVDYAGGSPSNYGPLNDGTPCSYEKPYDLCYQGTCVKGQCNSTDPVCNWCPDGYCNNNTHIYTRQLGKGWTRLTVIPHEATQLSVHIATPVPLNIAIRERRRDRPILQLNKHSRTFEIDHRQYDLNKQGQDYLKYDIPQNLQIIDVDSNVIDIKERFGSEGEVAAAGSLLRWTQTESDVIITSNSRLQSDLMIMAVPSTASEDTIIAEVSVNYSTPAGRTRPMEYRWSSDRGPCSSSCGGGVRAVRPRCPRDQTCGPLRYERCNSHSCDIGWSAGEWEECSATCGENGYQERQLFCVPANISATTKRELIRHSVSPALCPSSKPDKTQPCNRIPCPVYWQEMSWTPCSSTCGRGVSYRPLFCPAPAVALCGPKPREHRRHCRLRKCPRLPAACPATDATQYCELFTSDQLERNCVVPPFRKYCCNACQLGTCVKGQCNSTDPVCNWCPDGYCNNNTHIYTRQLGKGWIRLTVIPHEATQLSVHIATPVPLNIAIRERRRDRPILQLNKHSRTFEIDHRQYDLNRQGQDYLKYDVPQNLQIIDVDSNVIDIKERFGTEGEVAAAGSLLRWTQTESDVIITSNSRLQSDLMIMAVPSTASEDTIIAEVSVNYSTPAGRTRPMEYRWSSDRGPCSSSCGGGVRAVRPRCPRDQTCGPLRYERCNSHSCDIGWSAGEWEECSATCGENGYQERQLFCVPANISATTKRELIRHSVSPALCPTSKPDKTQPCNRIPCPVYWQEMNWTPCSSTCGRGVSYRPLFCPAPAVALCGPKPREHRRHCRLRKCPRLPAACPATDATQYCELFTSDQLERNCVVPPFRKYCCNACQLVRKRGE